MNAREPAVKPPAEPKELSHDPRRLKRRRIAAGMSATEAAEAAGCSKSNLSKLENGVHGASPGLLAVLAALYGCETTDLMPPETAGAMT